MTTGVLLLGILIGLVTGALMINVLVNPFEGKKNKKKTHYKGNSFTGKEKAESENLYKNITNRHKDFLPNSKSFSTNKKEIVEHFNT